MAIVLKIMVNNTFVYVTYICITDKGWCSLLGNGIIRPQSVRFVLD